MNRSLWPLLLLAASSTSLALGGEAELFDRAEKVVLAEVVHLGGMERPPDVHPGKRYQYQAMWVKDVELFKGPKSSPQRGYDVILIPVKGRLYAPPLALDGPLQDQDLPDDDRLLLFLTRDSSGALTLLDGREGLFTYPGKSRLATLRSRAASAGGGRR